jgi:hypothetical protein
MIAEPGCVLYAAGHAHDDGPAVAMTVEGRPVLDTAAVARLLGVQPKTVSQYLVESKGEGRYADRPFPPPHGRVGGRPYWLPDQADAIRAWAAGRPGQGVGGGRPRRSRRSR